jgi:phage/plasmid-associated DNA primase
MVASTATATAKTAKTAKPAFADLQEFEAFIRDMCINGSGIDPELFDAAIEFHQDVEFSDGNDAETPIHDALNWKHYTRFTNQAQPSLYAAFFKNEDGSIWQAILSFPSEDGKKPYSYLAPKSNGDRCFLPPVPQSIREKIGDKLGIEVPTVGTSFWEFVRNNSDVPRIVTEGGKKALAGLSAGYVAISLYGCSCGVEKPNDISADDLLKSDLEGLAAAGSRWLLALDKDIKAVAKKAVSVAKRRLINILSSYGCHAVDIPWKASVGKGLDDFIVKNGESKLDFIFQYCLSILGEKLGDSPKEEKPSFCQLAFKNLYSDNDYICAANQLYRWEGSYYKLVSDGSEKRRIRDFCNSYYKTFIDKQTGQLTKYYPYAKNSRVGEALDWAKQSFHVDIDQLNPSGLNCLNGILQIVWDGDKPSWELVPHSPDYYYTYPPLVEYNPKADSRDCDRLLDALDAPQRDIFLKVIAASLDLPNVRKYKGRLIRALLLRGTGSNGKDALREAVSTIYGKQGMTSATLADFAQYDDGRRFPLSSLIHSRINWASENTNSSKLDRIQSLKAAITGNPLIAECKGKDGQEFTPNAVFLFNINDVPNLQGSLEAILSRYGVLDFKKTYKTNADPAKGELEADPRFAYDSLFLRLQVCPALLNRLLDALKDLMKNGIDYDCTNEALEDIQSENSHLFAFMKDSGLGYMPNSCVSANEIWQQLEQWYRDNGTLTYEESATGKLKAIWADQPRFNDRNIKAINQVLARFKQLLPKAKIASVTHESGKRNIQVLDGVGFIVNKDFCIAISNFSTPVAHQFPHQETLTNQDLHTTHTNFIYSKGENEKNVDILEAVTNLPDTVTENEGKTNLDPSLINDHNFPNSNIAADNIGVGGVGLPPRADSGDLDCCGTGVENSLIAMQSDLLRMENQYQIGENIFCYPTLDHAERKKQTRARILAIEYSGHFLISCEVEFFGKNGDRQTAVIGGGSSEWLLRKVS